MLIVLSASWVKETNDDQRLTLICGVQWTCNSASADRCGGDGCWKMHIMFVMLEMVDGGYRPVDPVFLYFVFICLLLLVVSSFWIYSQISNKSLLLRV